MDSLITVINILCVSLQILIGILDTCFFFRALLSWFNPEGEGVIAGLLYLVTEPVLIPIRALLDRLHIGQGLPIDLSFFIAIILLPLLFMSMPTVVI